jgi:hypothetical protein
MQRAHACQTWQLPTACHTAERMGSMPLHSLTTVKSGTCQCWQVASYPTADEAGYGGSARAACHTRRNYPPPATRQSAYREGEAEWDIGERMILRRRDGAEMVQPPKKAGDIPPASS